MASVRLLCASVLLTLACQPLRDLDASVGVEPQEIVPAGATSGGGTGGGGTTGGAGGGGTGGGSTTGGSGGATGGTGGAPSICLAGLSNGIVKAGVDSALGTRIAVTREGRFYLASAFDGVIAWQPGAAPFTCVSRTGVTAVAVGATSIYYAVKAGVNEGVVYAVDQTDCGNETLVATVDRAVRYLTTSTDGATVFWVNEGSGTVEKCARNCADSPSYQGGVPSTPLALIATSATLYIGSGAPGQNAQVFAANIAENGTGSAFTIPGFVDPTSLALASGYFYGTRNGTDAKAAFRCNAGASQCDALEPLVPDGTLLGPTALAVGDTDVLISDERRLLRCPLEGCATAPTPLKTAPGRGVSVARSEQCAVWLTEQSGGTFLAVDLQ